MYSGESHQFILSIGCSGGHKGSRTPFSRGLKSGCFPQSHMPVVHYTLNENRRKSHKVELNALEGTLYMASEKGEEIDSGGLLSGCPDPFRYLEGT